MLRRPVILTTRRRGRKTRRAPGYDLRRPSASPLPCLFPSPIVPSSSAPHSVTSPLFLPPRHAPPIFGNHSAPSIPTTFLDISNPPAAMSLCLRICMVPLTEPTSSLLATSLARALASASFCALRRQPIPPASSCLLSSSRLASYAFFASLVSSSFPSPSCSLKSAS